jgi:peptide/nickel transport system permease protein
VSGFRASLPEPVSRALFDFEWAFIVAIAFLIVVSATHFVPDQLPIVLSAPIVLRDSVAIAAAFAAIRYLTRRLPRSRVVLRLGFMYLLTLFCITLFMTWAYNFYSYGSSPAFLVNSYWLWLRTALLHGDFGSSAQALNTFSVDSLIRNRAPITLEIVVLATVVSVVLAVPGALISALRPHGVVDRVTTVVSSLAASLPVFVSAVFVVEILSLQLHWVLSQGWVPIRMSLSGNLRTAVLPVTTLVLATFPGLLRILRGDLVSLMDSDFVLAAKSRGQPDWYVLTRHAFRPALATFVTAVALQVGQVISSVIIVEFFFTIPGLGLSLWDALQSTPPDPEVVRGVVTFFALLYVTVNLVSDVVYRYLDPRDRWR